MMIPFNIDRSLATLLARFLGWNRSCALLFKISHAFSNSSSGSLACLVSKRIDAARLAMISSSMPGHATLAIRCAASSR